MTATIAVFQVDSFTNTPFLGNPAGVVLNAEVISDDVRQRIAREMNCSETAFVSQKGHLSFEFRYYTPETEVDLCGHATIAALHILHEQMGLTGDLMVDTNVGLLPMHLDESGRAWMRQAMPQFRSMDKLTQDEVLAALRIPHTVLDTSMPFELSFTGLWDIMVPIENRTALLAVAPNFADLTMVSRRLGAASVHAYTRDTVEPTSTIHARDFSPAVGVNEDPHTGTATGALAALLVARGILAPGTLQFEQGWSVLRPGHIHVEVTPGLVVSVGGDAVTVLSGSLRVS